MLFTDQTKGNKQPLRYTNPRDKVYSQLRNNFYTFLQTPVNLQHSNRCGSKRSAYTFVFQEHIMKTKLKSVELYQSFWEGNKEGKLEILQRDY